MYVDDNLVCSVHRDGKEDNGSCVLTRKDKPPAWYDNLYEKTDALGRLSRTLRTALMATTAESGPDARYAAAALADETIALMRAIVERTARDVQG